MQPDSVTRQELATLILELGADRAEMRLDIAGLRQEMRGGFAAVETRLDKLTDALADFRREYQQHTHG